MDARRRFAVVSLLVIFALFLQSITPAVAITSPQHNAADATTVDMAANNTIARAAEPAAPISSAAEPGTLLVQRPQLEGVAPMVPHPQLAAAGVRHADRSAPVTLPNHLQPLAGPAPSVGQSTRPQVVSARPVRIVGWADSTPVGTLANFSLMAALTELVNWFTDAGSAADSATPRAVNTNNSLPPASAAIESRSPQTTQSTRTAPSAAEAPGWAVGNVIGLNCGTSIRVGQGDASPVTYTVQENNYQVYIKDGPRFADGQTWWDIDRRAVSGNPNDGTGWMSQQQSEAATCDGGGTRQSTGP